MDSNLNDNLKKVNVSDISFPYYKCFGSPVIIQVLQPWASAHSFIWQHIVMFYVDPFLFISALL